MAFLKGTKPNPVGWIVHHREHPISLSPFDDISISYFIEKVNSNFSPYLDLNGLIWLPDWRAGASLNN